MRLPKDLIEDFKKNVMIIDLSKKFGLSYFVINRGLVKLGLKQVVRGGYREGGGRKKIEQIKKEDRRSEELKAVMKRNTEINDKHLAKQSGGNTAKSRLYKNTYYTGGF